MLKYNPIEVMDNMTGAETITTKRPFYKEPDFVIFFIIVMVATALRLYQLDVRPFHHDEAAVGSFTYKLFTNGNYEYNPVFHGPFLYFLTFGIFNLIGDSIFSARLVPALTGVGMVLLTFALRRYLGSPGWLIAAAFFAVSPSFLYYSRFFRNDIFITFFTLTTIICAAKYLEKGNKPGRLLFLALGAASLGFSVTAKENAYVIIAMLVFPVVLFNLYNIGKKLRNRNFIHMSTVFIEQNIFRIVLDIGILVIVFLIIYVTFYSNFFSDLPAAKTATYNAFSHWFKMHEIERLDGPPYYYFPLLFLYELPIILFAFTGSIDYIVGFVKSRENPMMAFMVYWFAANLAFYSYLGEKVPWLILHPLLPAIIIASAYLGESLPNLKQRPRWAEAIFIVILVVSSSFFIYTSYNLNYRNYANPAEPLIQASQAPKEFNEFMDTLNQVAMDHQGYRTKIQVADEEMETQLLWHLRHYTNIKWKVNLDENPPLDAYLIIVHDLDADYVDEILGDDYQRLDSAKMAWYHFKPSDINYWYVMYRWMDREQSEYGVVLYYR